MSDYNGFPMSIIVAGFFVTSMAYLICFCCCIVQFFLRRSRALQTPPANAVPPGIEQKNDTLKRKFVRHFKDTLNYLRGGPEEPSSSQELEVSCSGSCPICFEDYTGDPREIFIGYIKKCGHYYHFDCVWRWLEAKSTCPLCRNKVHLTEEDIHGIALCNVPHSAQSAQTTEYKDVAKGNTSNSDSDSDTVEVAIPDSTTVIVNIPEVEESRVSEEGVPNKNEEGDNLGQCLVEAQEESATQGQINEAFDHSDVHIDNENVT